MPYLSLFTVDNFFLLHRKETMCNLTKGIQLFAYDSMCNNHVLCLKGGCHLFFKLSVKRNHSDINEVIHSGLNALKLLHEMIKNMYIDAWFHNTDTVC